MAFTTADLEALERAIASGELTVNVNGESVTYRSMADLKAAYSFIEQKLDKAAGKRRPRTLRQTGTGKGI